MRGLLAAVVEDLNLLCNAQHTASIDNLNQGELEGGRNWVEAKVYQSKILSRHNSLTGRTNCPKVPFIISVRNSFFLLLILSADNDEAHCQKPRRLSSRHPGFLLNLRIGKARAPQQCWRLGHIRKH